MKTHQISNHPVLVFNNNPVQKCLLQNNNLSRYLCIAFHFHLTGDI